MWIFLFENELRGQELSIFNYRKRKKNIESHLAVGGFFLEHLIIG